MSEIAHILYPFAFFPESGFLNACRFFGMYENNWGYSYNIISDFKE